jgi:hypothetical protein
MLVQDASDLPRVRHDASDVAARREGPQHRPVGVLRLSQRSPELGNVHEPVGIDADLHDLGEALPPRQKIGVVLVRPDEYHPPLLRAQLRGEASAELAGRRREADDLMQALDRRRRAGAAEE